MDERQEIDDLAQRLRALAEALGRQSPKAAALTSFKKSLTRIERELTAASSATGSAGAASTAADPAPSAAQTSQDGSYRIWADGSCSPNPGSGGWGAIIDHNGHREELSGGDPDCTNNIMELTGAIEALRSTPLKAVVHVTTDSQYVKNGITQWIRNWKRKGWRKSDGKPVLNQALWRTLDGLTAERRVTWAWVRGHSGHPENERCDELANNARHALQ